MDKWVRVKRSGIGGSVSKGQGQLGQDQRVHKQMGHGQRVMDRLVRIKGS